MPIDSVIISKYWWILKSCDEEGTKQKLVQRVGGCCKPIVDVSMYPSLLSWRWESRISWLVDTFRDCCVKAKGLMESDEWRSVFRNLSGTASDFTRLKGFLWDGCFVIYLHIGRLLWITNELHWLQDITEAAKQT